MITVADLKWTRSRYSENFYTGKNNRWAVCGSNGREDTFRTRKLAKEFANDLIKRGAK